jgi:hypothetical protein
MKKRKDEFFDGSSLCFLSAGDSQYFIMEQFLSPLE